MKKTVFVKNSISPGSFTGAKKNLDNRKSGNLKIHKPRFTNRSPDEMNKGGFINMRWRLRMCVNWRAHRTIGRRGANRNRDGVGWDPMGGNPWEPKGIPWEGTHGRGNPWEPKGSHGRGSQTTHGRGTLGSPRDPMGGDPWGPHWEPKLSN